MAEMVSYTVSVDQCCEVHPVHDRQRRVLCIVLAVNAGMFLVEIVAGVMARSTALLADSADMLGDSLVYGFSLYVVGRGPAWQSRAALLKGLLMAAFGVGVLVEVGAKLIRGGTPDAELMSWVGVLALGMNGLVLSLLWRHRADDLNMRSVWHCSRNDVIANIGVLLAAGAVALTGLAWPDIAVGLGIAALFMRSAVEVIRAALGPAVPSHSG
jgi:cation diffusion facilitator family transporter